MCPVYSVNDVTGLYRRIWHPSGVRFVLIIRVRWSSRTPTTGYFLATLRVAVMLNDISGGLRGLRPPATFFATLRVGEVTPVLEVLMPTTFARLTNWQVPADK